MTRRARPICEGFGAVAKPDGPVGGVLVRYRPRLKELSRPNLTFEGERLFDLVQAILLAFVQCIRSSSSVHVVAWLLGTAEDLKDYELFEMR